MKQSLNQLHFSLRSFAIISVAFLFVLASTANAQLSYNELVLGDLGVPSAPTDIGALLLGMNVVSGRLENEATGFDPDAFSFEVPADLEVVDLTMTGLTGNARFLAVSQDAISEFDASGNLFTTLINESDVGTNILNGTLNNFGGSGVAGNLGAGTYSVWLQETDGSNVDYSFAITTVIAEAIPEPGSFTLISGGLLIAGLRRTRRGLFPA